MGQALWHHLQEQWSCLYMAIHKAERMRERHLDMKSEIEARLQETEEENKNCNWHDNHQFW